MGVWRDAIGGAGITVFTQAHTIKRMTETTTLHVVCLCAAWCRLCDDYAAVLARVVSEQGRPEAVLRQHWIDIEDGAEMVGDVDVETFPTLVLIGPEGVLFAGPVAPHADTLRRLLQAAVAGASGPLSPVSAEIRALAQRLRERWALEERVTR